MSAVKPANAGAIAVGVVVGGIVALLVRAWLLMLLIGAAHHEVSEAIPPIGYLGSLVLALLLSVLVGGVRASR